MKCFDSKELKVWSNKRNRTFTIRTYYKDGKFCNKYRTIPQSKEDFRYYNGFASLNDWKSFLKTDEYYLVR